MGFDEVGRLNEHATRPTGRIKDPPMIRLDDFDDQLDQRRGREELAAFLTFSTGEIAEEVFVDLAERVPLSIDRDGGEVLQQSDAAWSFRSSCSSWAERP